MNSDPTIDPLIALALLEDLGDRGDITSQTFIDSDHISIGKIVSREDAVVSGIRIMDRVFEKVDPDLKTTAVHPDGDEVAKGDVIYTVEGKTRSILTGERTALNFLQRLSGVATVTREFHRLVSHTKVKLLDTRKTTPGWRIIEKEAVVHGGGDNHRMGLYDAAMIKDNHLVANPDPASIEKQIAGLKEKFPGTMVIVEADHLSQVDDFLRVKGVNRILLDNMSPEQLWTAVRKRDEVNPDVQLEASGGVNLDTVKTIAETGVDFISIGALTHSICAIDFGMDLETISQSRPV
ncbi:MAG: carboxylating nicotinate-nucleotide diphosphorylase [Verrucomicrobiales bacterium]|nr:carboxylating nicotinate-nucleotide diphosphorylase [Verrucomicrobiales bacterium]